MDDNSYRIGSDTYAQDIGVIEIEIRYTTR